MNKRKNLNEKGITLVALAITIIIILILAGVTLTTALGQNGLFQRAKLAVEEYEIAQENEESELSELANQLGDLKINQPKEKTTGPNGKLLPKTVTGTNHGNVEGEDRLGNPVVIPGGFKFAGEDDDTVEDGIIIEDGEGNQFVWIPVSNINGDNNEKTTNNQKEEDLIKLEDGTKIEITLGRYIFNATNGTPALQQAGNNYAATVIINSYFQETSNHPNGGMPPEDLKGFLNSVEARHGYYIGRYEASFGSGTNIGDYKPAVKKSISNSTSKMEYISGTLWNFIVQEIASKVSRNMYNGEDVETRYVKSDLVNSYAWDTAIVYIQAMKKEYENYANALDGNGMLRNTGTTGDEKCHIFDMAGNVEEWTTEYSTQVDSVGNRCCVARGGAFHATERFSTTYRYNIWTTHNTSPMGFRPLIYLI